MQLSLNKRFAQGFSLLASYTWSKMIDDSSGDDGTSTDPFNFRNQRGISNLDIPHRFVGSFLYELPRLVNRGALLKYVAGGWDANGIVVL